HLQRSLRWLDAEADQVEAAGGRQGPPGELRLHRRPEPLARPGSLLRLPRLRGRLLTKAAPWTRPGRSCSSSPGRAGERVRGAGEDWLHSGVEDVWLIDLEVPRTLVEPLLDGRLQGVGRGPARVAHLGGAARGGGGHHEPDQHLGARLADELGTGAVLAFV